MTTADHRGTEPVQGLAARIQWIESAATLIHATRKRSRMSLDAIRRAGERGIARGMADSGTFKLAMLDQMVMAVDALLDSLRLKLQAAEDEAAKLAVVAQAEATVHGMLRRLEAAA